MARTSDSRERLLEAASDLVWKGSYYGTSVDLICETTGLKKGSFYHHFASKEELMSAALDNAWVHFRAFLDEAFSASRSPLDRFRFYAAQTLAQQEALRERHGLVLGCPLYSLGTEIGGQEPALRKKIDEHLMLLGRYFTSTLREAQQLGAIPQQDLDATAELLLGFTEGALSLARIRNDVAPLRQLEAGILRLIGASAT